MFKLWQLACISVGCFGCKRSIDPNFEVLRYFWPFERFYNVVLASNFNRYFRHGTSHKMVVEKRNEKVSLHFLKGMEVSVKARSEGLSFLTCLLLRLLLV